MIRFSAARALLLASALTLLLAVAPRSTRSCGPSLYWDDTRFSLFAPDLDETTSGLEPFYYTERFLNSTYPDPAGLDYLRNCREWRDALGAPGIPPEAVRAVVYTMPAEDFLLRFRTGQWGDSARNPFIAALTQKSARPLLDYLAFARRVEIAPMYDPDPWDEQRQYANNASDTAGMPPRDGGWKVVRDSLARTAETRANAAPRGSFLRARYGFQAVKIRYYSALYGSGGDVWETPAAPRIRELYASFLAREETVVADWAGFYDAMSEPDSMQRAAGLLRTFHRSEEKKVAVYNQLSRTRLDAVIASNPTDRTVLEAALALRAMKSPEPALPLLRRLRQAFPQSRYLPVLAAREVAKCEAWIATPELLHFHPMLRQNDWSWYGNHGDTTYTYYAAQNLAADKRYADTLAAFFNAIAATSTKPAVLQLAAVHLHNILGNDAAVRRGLAAIKPQTSQALERQRLVEEILIAGRAEDVSQPTVQAKLYTALERLENLSATVWQLREPDEDMQMEPTYDESIDDLREILLYLSRRFEARGDRVTAGLLYNKASILTNAYDGGGYGEPWEDRDTTVDYRSIAYWDREGRPTDIDTLLQAIHDASPTPFQRYIRPANLAPDNFYRDLKGTLLMREAKYAEALKVFQQIPDTFWATTYEYKHFLPQTSVAHAGTLVPGCGDAPVAYRLPSKKEICAHIVRMEDTLARKAWGRGGEAALCYRLATAYYHLTYDGKAWMMFSYGQSAREGTPHFDPAEDHWAWFTFHPVGSRYAARYYEAADATAMYRRAARIAGTTDRETAARSLLMLAMIDRNAEEYRRDNNAPFGIYSWDRNPPAARSKYLEELLGRYGGTQTAGLAQAACPDVAGE